MAKRKKKKVADLPRIRAIVALRKLSEHLQSDILAGGDISAKFKIPTHRPAQLGSDISLSQDKLLDAFRQILAGKDVEPILDNAGKPIDAVVSIVANGAGSVKINQNIFSFAYIGLLSPDENKRLEYLEGYLKQRSLASVYANELRQKMGREAPRNEEFLTVVETLISSQESFIEAVRARGQELSSSDLLPEDFRHWDNLLAPPKSSKNLQEFLGDEIDAERSLQMAADPVRAFYTTSLSYCAPGLVPVEEYRSVQADVVLRAVERAARFPDHFALVGAFEICADWISRDERFEAAGSKILDQLLGDIEKLLESCTFFSAAFTMVVPRLAQHKEFRRKPPFWRRLAAAAQASLIVRACGINDAAKVFKWAVEYFGKSFLFAVLLEGAEEPRWKPDWVTPRYLVADAFGRIDIAVINTPEACRPREWVERVEKAREWISNNKVEVLCALPAIGECCRREQPTMAETRAHQPMFERVCTEPSFDTLLMCAPSIFIAGVPKEILEPCHALMGQLQKTSPRWDEENTQFRIQILAFVALQAQDVALANLVAEFCVEKAREIPANGTSLEIVCRLLECACANPDAASAMGVLARRLEGVAYLSPASTLIDLHDSLVQLQLLNDSLSRGLGKATAASRLGRSAA